MFVPLSSGGEIAPSAAATDQQDTQPLQDIREAKTPPDTSKVLSPQASSDERRSQFQRCRKKTKPEKAGLPLAPEDVKVPVPKRKKKQQDEDQEDGEAWE